MCDERLTGGEGRLQEELRKHIARGKNVECVSCLELFVRD